MRFRKVICLGGLIALTGCCHTVPTNEFVDPRFIFKNVTNDNVTSEFDNDI